VKICFLWEALTPFYFIVCEITVTVDILLQVVLGEFPMSLSQWVTTPERNRVLDFVICSSSRDALALTPQWPKIDLMLFFR